MSEPVITINKYSSQGAAQAIAELIFPHNSDKRDRDELLILLNRFAEAIRDEVNA